MPSGDRVVLLTGASSGIGRATAALLKDRGFRVYGTSRGAPFPLEPGYEGGFLKMLRMDVTVPAQAEDTVCAVLDTEGRIDVLINCAGMGVAGSLEDTSSQEAWRQMDVNLLGAHSMIRAVMPAFRAQGSGRIINISSVGGFISIPFQGFYSASKFAMESLTEVLRMEAKPFGVKVSAVLPGDTATGFTANRIYSEGARKSTVYRDSMSRALYTMEQAEIKGKSAESVARVVLRLIMRKNPPVRVTVGFSYKLIRFAKRLIPDRLLLYIITKLYMGGKAPGKEWFAARNISEE